MVELFVVVKGDGRAETADGEAGYSGEKAEEKSMVMVVNMLRKESKLLAMKLTTVVKEWMKKLKWFVV